MLSLHQFTFNPFAENTFVLWDETRTAVIVDPGMVDAREERELLDLIEREQLKPAWLVNTHTHIDHVLGNAFVKKQYNIPFVAHKEALEPLRMSEAAAKMYGIPYETSPQPDQFFEEGKAFRFGTTELEVLYVPGHCPGHVALVDHNSKQVIAGDVLFRGSVGRVDLPGGDGPMLKRSIQEKMYKLPDDYTVYCGHGPETTIGAEKASNPFVSATASVW